MREIDYSKLSNSSRLILQTANQLARCSHCNSVNAQILLVAIVQKAKEMVKFVLDKLNVDYSRFCSRLGELLQGQPRLNAVSPVFSASVVDVLVNAIEAYTRTNQGLVPPEIILLELTSRQNEASALFREFNVTKQGMSRAIGLYAAGNRVNSNAREEQTAPASLERFAVNLRKMAEEGMLEPTVGRDEEIRRILQIISRKTKNNPLLLGEPGTGKTAVIEGLAMRLNRGDVPEDMKQLQLYSLDVASLLAGASVQGEFESRLKSIIADIKANPSIILFIDEIHLLLGAGSGGGTVDAANMLKPEMARSGIKVIGATTFDEYNKYLESDQAFARRFQRIVIEEPSIDDAISILRGIKSRYEAHHKIKILDEAIVSAVNLSVKYVTDRFLPDKAIDVLDETASRMRLERSSVPVELDNLSRRVRRLEIERQSLVQDGVPTPRIDELAREISAMKDRENELNAKWVNERRQFDRLQRFQAAIEQLKANMGQAEAVGRYDEAARLERRIASTTAEMEALVTEMSETESPILKLALDSDDIKETIASSTGIPVNAMDADEFERLSQMPSALVVSVKGQEHAINAVCNVIKRSRLGLGNDNAPVGSFLFMGTTGVGKTELAKSLAGYLFGSREMLVRIDMSEYQQEHSVARLFGAPPGYIGFDQGGQLTEAVRRKPYSVILLDEIEKAHPKVCETLLQVLDDGRMTDGKGRVVNFKNCVIIMTSNLGAEQIQDADDCQSELLRQGLLHRLMQKTSPEFVNRIDEIVVFNKLSQPILESIARKVVGDNVLKLKAAGYDVRVDNEVYGYIASLVDAGMGARPVKRLVSRMVVDAIIDKTLTGELSKDAVIIIRVDNGQLSLENELCYEAEV